MGDGIHVVTRGQRGGVSFLVLPHRSLGMKLSLGNWQHYQRSNIISPQILSFKSADVSTDF